MLQFSQKWEHIRNVFLDDSSSYFSRYMTDQNCYNEDGLSFE